MQTAYQTMSDGASLRRLCCISYTEWRNTPLGMMILQKRRAKEALPSLPPTTAVTERPVQKAA